MNDLELKLTRATVRQTIESVLKDMTISVTEPLSYAQFILSDVADVLTIMFGSKDDVDQFWQKHYGLSPELFRLNVEALKTHFGCLGVTLTKKPCSHPGKGVSKGPPPYYKESDFYCIKHKPK